MIPWVPQVFRIGALVDKTRNKSFRRWIDKLLQQLVIRPNRHMAVLATKGLNYNIKMNACEVFLKSVYFLPHHFIFSLLK